MALLQSKEGWQALRICNFGTNAPRKSSRMSQTLMLKKCVEGTLFGPSIFHLNFTVNNRPPFVPPFPGGTFLVEDTAASIMSPGNGELLDNWNPGR